MILKGISSPKATEFSACFWGPAPLLPLSFWAVVKKKAQDAIPRRSAILMAAAAAAAGAAPAAAARRFPIFINDQLGRTTRLEVLGEDAVHTVKRQLNMQLGIPQDQMMLLLGGRVLITRRRLTHYRIRAGSILHLHADRMRVYVSCLDGEMASVLLLPTDTVQWLRVRVQNEHNFVLQELRLGARTVAELDMQMVALGDSILYEYALPGGIPEHVDDDDDFPGDRTRSPTPRSVTSPAAEEGDGA